MKSPKFSILIRTIPQRKEVLQELLLCLEKQKTPEIEILIDGEYPNMTGTKCNDMIAKATGDYVAFIDDDDLVSEDYVSLILEAIEKKPDVITFDGWCEQEGAKPYRYIQKLNNGPWVFDKDGTQHVDATNIAVVKRELAKQCECPPIMYFEDRNYANILKTIAKTEIHIPKILHFHRFNPVKDYPM